MVSSAFVLSSPICLTSFSQLRFPSFSATCNPRSSRACTPVAPCRHSSIIASAQPHDDVADEAHLTDASLVHQHDAATAPPSEGGASLRERVSAAVQSPHMRSALTRVLLTVLVSTVVRHAAPALAVGGMLTTAANASPFAASLQAFSETSFMSGLTAAFLLVFVSEIGDKTFFISALLSMKYSRLLVLLGTMLALGSMTVISVAIGQIFHALPSSLNSTIPFDDYAAVALLLWFGFQSIRDGLAMKVDDDDELQDAKDVLAGKSAPQETSPLRVVTETTSLIFLAEWGDKSMLATVALAAAKSPLGVIVGGISGHFVASIIAVIGGSVLGKYISERSARLIGGVLFFVFALLTIFGIY